MKLNINIPDQKHYAFKSKAAKNKKTMTEVILEWINNYLKQK